MLQVEESSETELDPHLEELIDEAEEEDPVLLQDLEDFLQEEDE